jgi:hypothetical protein
MKFTITYARDIIDSVEATDINHAARLACAAVFACPKEYNARVLSIYRVDDPTPQLPAPITPLAA